MIAEVVFWASALALGYTWLAYPALCAALAARARRRGPRPRARPTLSVLVAAHNEATVIEAKLQSTLAQRYPPERLEVIVVSDASTDGTDERVARWRDPRVRLVRQEPRAGKAAALNRAAALARGEVLVFTDANARFTPGTLARLAAPFADPRVGLVSGQGRYAAPDGRSAAAVAGGYVRYETLIRRGESALGVLAAADGAVYALRRALFRGLRPADADDLLHPMQVALAGYACRFDPRAATVEPPARDAGQEYRRHVRIVAQGAALLAAWLPRLLRARRLAAVWALVSHRLLRWTTAAFLAGALGAALALRGRAPVYDLALGFQVAFYALAAAGGLAERWGRARGPLAFPYYFCVMAAAGAAGLARAARGRAEAVWAPTGARASDRAA